MEVSNQAFICQENRSTYDEIRFVIIANVNQESDADEYLAHNRNELRPDGNRIESGVLGGVPSRRR